MRARDKRLLATVTGAAGALLLGGAPAAAQCPGGGDCCIANGTPGCDDETCCTIVCAIDPFCCDTEWDGICAGEAMDLCEICTCGGDCVPVECPPGALDPGETCGDDVNGGCSSLPHVLTDAHCGDVWCGNAWADGGTRDTDWYLVEHGGGIISATLTSEFPGLCFIVDGILTCNLVVVGDIGCSVAGFPLLDARADMPPGPYVVFVAPGDCSGDGIFEGYPCGTENDYVVEIFCTPPCADLDGDATVGATDLLLLLEAWGACPECPADLDGNDVVDVNDLLALLSAWGPCA